MTSIAVKNPLIDETDGLPNESIILLPVNNIMSLVFLFTTFTRANNSIIYPLVQVWHEAEVFQQVVVQSNLLAILVAVANAQVGA